MTNFVLTIYEMEIAMNIYFFGDSISFGQGISVDLTWVNQIAQQLRREYGGGNYGREYFHQRKYDENGVGKNAL